MVVSRGGRVIVEMPQALIRLLRQLPGVAQWIPWGQPLPGFGMHCPLLTLPLVFGTTLQTIPAQTPPLQADPDLKEAWKLRLVQPRSSSAAPALKVGLIWAGSPNHLNDHNRSITLPLLAPLATVRCIQFYSLQKGPAGAQAANPPQGMQIIDPTEELHDFAEAAAMISNLDLTITVDTSVAHLAGAMSKPVWVLLPFVSDWRWLETRQDSPWYPTMRLFRQSSAGKWDDVISHVVDALAAFGGK
jgi:hypothetical protein